MTEPTTGWRQLNLTCEHWQAAEEMALTQLRPLLTDAEDAGIITAWWFVRKGDTWRVRLRPATPAFPDQITTALMGQETVRTWSQTIYEPETHAFGGPTAMDIAHDLFHADSLHLLDHLAHTDHDHRRELATILATRLLRAAGQDRYEQGHCWAQLATHRTPAWKVTEPAPSTITAVHRLITATTDTAASPLHSAPTWIEAFEHAGRRLADLAAHGTSPADCAVYSPSTCCSCSTGTASVPPSSMCSPPQPAGSSSARRRPPRTRRPPTRPAAPTRLPSGR